MPTKAEAKVEVEPAPDPVPEPDQEPERSLVSEPEPESEPLPEQTTAADTESEPEPEPKTEPTPVAPPKKSFFAKLTEGLAKTRDNIGGLFESVFSGTALDDDFYDELEEALIVADVGAKTTGEILTRLKAAVKEEKLTQPDEAREALRRVVSGIMSADTPFIGDEKAVILIVGVNGVGKTTSIGKIAHYYKSQRRSVVLAAADTFRAAATEQLLEWGKRADVPVIKHGEGADPAAVVFDAIGSAKAKNRNLLICDTAGRLHNKKNLMDELSKIGRVIAREYPEARVETLLVLDATTGQNAVNQAKVFAESVPLSGIILTKLDGTAKGGVVIAIKQDTGIPVRFIGVGEALDDLQPFDPSDFAKALF